MIDRSPALRRARESLNGIDWNLDFACIFGNGWESVTPQPGDFPYKGDTVVGNDV